MVVFSSTIVVIVVVEFVLDSSMPVFVALNLTLLSIALRCSDMICPMHSLGTAFTSKSRPFDSYPPFPAQITDF